MRILLVEDEQAMAVSLRRGLTADGFAVDIAGNGVDGLHAATTGGYDAVVLDLMLPGIHGYEVLRRMRAAGVWTPVLVLTAKDGEYDEADALDEGADDYLTKPFSYVVLCARLRAMLRRGSAPRPAVLHAGPLRLDPAARTVSLDGEDVTLTTREFRLLEYLMRRAGDVVAKAELLEHVWEAPEEVGGLNVVEVYVGYLRRKLGHGLIETIRGAGYRLRPG